MLDDLMSPWRAAKLLLMFAAAASVGCSAVSPLPSWVATTGAAVPGGDIGRSPEMPLTGPLLYQLMAAEIAVQRGELGSAYATYLEITRQTRDARFAQRATEIAISGRAFAQALESATLWRELAPQSSEAAQTETALLVASNRFADARPLLAEQIRTATPPVDALTRTQRLLARSTERAGAFALLEALAAPYANDPALAADVKLIIANGAHAAGLNERAADEAKAALKLRPDSERAALLAAQFVSRPDGKESASGRAQALDLLREFLARQPDSVDARLTYARLLVADGKLPDARGQFDQVLRGDQRNIDALYALGVLALDGEPPRNEARRHFERYLDALEQAPQANRDPDAAYINLARIAEDEKKFDEALAWLARVGSGVQVLNARTRQALVLGKMKRVDEARKLLADLPSGNDAARVQIAQTEGQLLREARRYRDALDVLGAALARSPDDSGLLYDAAMAAERLDQVDVMETHLRRLMQLKPDDPHAFNALGFSLADRNQRLPEALALIEKAHALAPEDAYILDSLGWAHFRLGNTARAREYLERAYKKRPDAEVGAHYGEVLWTLGSHNEARTIWRESQSRDGENETLRSTLARLKVRL